jgi:hypothetical protein
VRWTIVAISLASLAVGVPLLGCGEDRMEGGLAPAGEEGVPMQAAEGEVAEEEEEEEAKGQGVFEVEEEVEVEEEAPADAE